MKQHLTNTCIVSPRRLQEKKVDMEASIYPLAVWRPRANRESDNNLHSGNTAGFFWRFPSCMKPRIAQSLLVVTCAFQGTIWRTLETMDDMTSSDLWDAPSCWEGILLNLCVELCPSFSFLQPNLNIPFQGVRSPIAQISFYILSHNTTWNSLAPLVSQSCFSILQVFP